VSEWATRVMGDGESEGKRMSESNEGKSDENRKGNRA